MTRSQVIAWLDSLEGRMDVPEFVQEAESAALVSGSPPPEACDAYWQAMSKEAILAAYHAYCREAP